MVVNCSASAELDVKKVSVELNNGLLRDISSDTDVKSHNKIIAGGVVVSGTIVAALVVFLASAFSGSNRIQQLQKVFDSNAEDSEQFKHHRMAALIMYLSAIYKPNSNWIMSIFQLLSRKTSLSTLSIQSTSELAQIIDLYKAKMNQGNEEEKAPTTALLMALVLSQNLKQYKLDTQEKKKAFYDKMLNIVDLLFWISSNIKTTTQIKYEEFREKIISLLLQLYGGQTNLGPIRGEAIDHSKELAVSSYWQAYASVFMLRFFDLSCNQKSFDKQNIIHLSEMFRIIKQTDQQGSEVLLSAIILIIDQLFHDKKRNESIKNLSLITNCSLNRFSNEQPFGFDLQILKETFSFNDKSKHNFDVMAQRYLEIKNARVALIALLTAIKNAEKDFPEYQKEKKIRCDRIIFHEFPKVANLNTKEADNIYKFIDSLFTNNPAKEQEILTFDALEEVVNDVRSNYHNSKSNESEKTNNKLEFEKIDKISKNIKKAIENMKNTIKNEKNTIPQSSEEATIIAFHKQVMLEQQKNTLYSEIYKTIHSDFKKAEEKSLKDYEAFKTKSYRMCNVSNEHFELKNKEIFACWIYTTCSIISAEKNEGKTKKVSLKNFRKVIPFLRGIEIQQNKKEDGKKDKHATRKRILLPVALSLINSNYKGDEIDNIEGLEKESDAVKEQIIMISTELNKGVDFSEAKKVLDNLEPSELKKDEQDLQKKKFRFFTDYIFPKNKNNKKSKEIKSESKE